MNEYFGFDEEGNLVVSKCLVEQFSTALDERNRSLAVARGIRQAVSDQLLKEMRPGGLLHQGGAEGSAASCNAVSEKISSSSLYQALSDSISSIGTTPS